MEGNFFKKLVEYFKKVGRSEPEGDSSTSKTGISAIGGVEKVPHTIYNGLSIFGFFLGLIGFLGSFFLFVASAFSGKESGAYQGIFYLLFILFMIVGIGFFAGGYFRENKRRKEGRKPSFTGRFWSSNPILTIMLIPGMIMITILLVGAGMFQVYHSTETTSFCGETCHVVMEPEWVTYHNSSHARVKCAECHIGSGAGWYVKAKISGIRQIFAVAFNSFPRPIPTPIENLRPARETCEQCHWPSRFIGYQENTRTYYRADEKNTPHKIRMLYKIGGEKTGFMKGSGIHYHMLFAQKVEYVARDHKRQEIPWVRVSHKDKSITEYNDTDKPLTDEEKKTLEVHTVDCMDCHNRPAHTLDTPMRSVNQAIENGYIPIEMPFVKKEAVRVLDPKEDYATKDIAMTEIASKLRSFYTQNYPEIVDKESEKLEKTIKGVQDIYKKTIFPEMKAKWSAYPNNIGHRDWPGCFRCHKDTLKSSDGNAIFTKCNKCHLILAQGADVDDVNVNFKEGLEFVHPDGGDKINEYKDCASCHSGGFSTYE